MIRIIAGKWRGKKLNAHHDGVTRPTRDRVRESLFNILDHLFLGNWSEKIVCDAFAGTGALGLEALSRGALEAYFVEPHQETFYTLKENIEACSKERVFLFKETFEKTLLKEKFPQKCHLIFLDPPYAFKNKGDLFDKITAGNLLEKGGIICFEMAQKETLLPQEGYTLLDERTYGITKILFFQKQ